MIDRNMSVATERRCGERQISSSEPAASSVGAALERGRPSGPMPEESVRMRAISGRVVIRIAAAASRVARASIQRATREAT